MSPTHLLPSHHFNIHFKESSHPEDGSCKFIQNCEYLTKAQRRNTRKTIISSMHIFWPYISCCTCSSLSTILTTARNMLHFATCIETVHNQTYTPVHAVMYSHWLYDDHPSSHSSSWQMCESQKPNTLWQISHLDWPGLHLKQKAAGFNVA